MSLKAWCWSMLFSVFMWSLWVAFIIAISVIVMDPIGAARLLGWVR